MVHEIALTIKPTLSCNMRCRHCFNGDDLNASNLIEVESVYKFLEIASKEYKDVKVTFHGGEPSLAGFDFYDKVFSCEHRLHEKYGTEFSNNFTTNGLALDDKIIDLLIANNVLINVSFDGPYNSVLRQNTNKVYDNICKLQERKAKFRLFCTISAESYPHLFEIYKWFNERQLNFKILPIEPRGYACEDKTLIMDPDSFVEELVKVYRYWIKDLNCKVKFYTFEEFAALRRNTQFKLFWFNREIALNPDGKIYPFGRPNDVNFCLGEPSKVSSLEECFNSDEYSRMISILKECRERFCTECESAHICNGVAVCMSYMYVDSEELLKYSCNQSNKIFCNILKVNDEIIRDFENNNIQEYNEVIKKNFGMYANREG